MSGGYNSPSPSRGGGAIPTSASSSDLRALGSSTPVEHAGSTGSGEGAVDVGVDPASHNFFSPDYRNSRHEDLRQMLEGNKDQQKLEAMKRIIGMVAKGKDASDLFPAVVKNVVSKNIEVKKLVYVYLVRYAEEQQDLALLSISTFQRALKDPNQLIRASALRVLSSIRVPVIVPIMMLAIKESASDMSPYVRKTAAVAIPKMFSLDPEQKEECVQVIEKLLADRTTLVAGAVVAAFEEVCPDRIDLIHKNYRKLCSLLVDVDEWGQVIIINMLTRYARTQFVDPNKGHDPSVDADDPKHFYDSDSKESPSGDVETPPPPARVAMDPDHRLLLRTCKPLLQSRNNAVVMAVAQLYYYLAPRAEVALCVRALVRLLRSHREGQFVVLTNIVSMSIRRKDLFEPYLKSFFVRSNSDPLHIRLLKLEILTNLATESNISAVLREFQTYISQTDKEFVAATIQAIGRCASNIKGVSETCLNGLVSLLSKKDEAVVAESVVVVKKLLQTQPQEHKAIITHMAKLVHDITVPMARASILWLLGEYSDQVPKIAPDVLRVMAKNFSNEEDIVKLQILNLAAKLYITNAKQTSLLAQYVFQLAKYDQNYDLRDRARFLKTMIIPDENGSQALLAKHAKKIFLSSKPAPVLESKFKDSDQFQLGTLSHVTGSRANGYHPLPDFPEVAPDPSVRIVEMSSPIAKASMGIVKTIAEKAPHEDPGKGFYSETEEDGEGVDSSGTTESADSGEEQSEDEEESGSEEESESDSDDEDEKTIADKPKAPPKAVQDDQKKDVDTDEEEDEEDDDDSDDSDDDDESDDDESEEEEVKPAKKPVKSKESSVGAAVTAAAAAAPAPPSSLLLDLLDFDAIGSPTSAMPLMPTSGAGLVLAPKMASLSLLDDDGGGVDSSSAAIHSTYVSSYSAPLKELLGSLLGSGLVVHFRFTRAPNLHSDKAATVELVLTNGGAEELKQIEIGEKRLPNGMKLFEFSTIPSLLPNGGRTAVTMGVDFNDSIQKIGFDLEVGGRVHSLALTPPVGEINRACTMSEDNFLKEKKKLAGMNEHAAKLPIAAASAASAVSMQSLVDAVLSAGAFGQVPSTEENSAKMAAKSMATSALSLVSIVKSEAEVAVTVNSEKLMFGSLLLKDIKTALEGILK